jgi:hypothetical protein
MPAVELQPLSLGEILDRTFSLYRSRFWLFVGILSIPELFLVVVGIFSGRFMQGQKGFGTPSSPPPTGPQMLEFLSTFALLMVVTLIAYFAIYAFALGATTVAVSRVYMNLRASIAESYRSLRGRIGRLLGLTFSVLLITFSPMIAALVLILLAFRLGSAGGTSGAIMAALLGMVGFLGMFGAMVLMVWLWLRYSLAIPALLVEDLRVLQALRRSALLSRGNRGRIFLLALLMAFITYAATILFQGPFIVMSMISASRGGEIPLWVTALSATCGGIGQTLTGPLMMIGLSLFYYDARVKKEALDLQIMLREVSGGASNPGEIPPAVPA